ncbi:hypothetical protein ACZ87_02435 [Candidatus Erwinia dacicola]|uniref:Uncharacterized protein n=1 Tax=Candidatus Erwinia dacicola TaxID=252393 RepID=A0A328TJF6_9GAMM|nr:hypothetical protein ACZ87_02435 [Candidatus Erwinia dacicola]
MRNIRIMTMLISAHLTCLAVKARREQALISSAAEKWHNRP